jgi:hypothetical protein
MEQRFSASELEKLTPQELRESPWLFLFHNIVEILWKLALNTVPSPSGNWTCQKIA